MRSDHRRGHGELDPAPDTPPPLPPTEAELRQRLREAITTYCAVDGAELQAAAAAQRAAEHVEACHTRLSTFASLDSEVDACLIGQLREAGRIELPDELRARSLQRQEARDALAAAEHAHTTLQRELTAARAQTTKARQTADAAAAEVLGIEAERLAQRHAELVAEADRVVDALIGFDRAVAGTHVALPGSVSGILLGHQRRLASAGIDTGTWEDAHAALLVDPDAEVSIELPPAPQPLDNTAVPIQRASVSVFVRAEPLSDDGSAAA